MKYSGLLLIILAVLLMGGCADTNSHRYANRGSIVDLANTCAMCGATVDDNYFANTVFNSMGPGNY
jgi:uncharacterized protein YceK